MGENVDILKNHVSHLNENIRSNAARIEQAKQVITQYENQTQIFQEFPKNLKKSVLVPIGSKGFLRGQIVHTNEIFHKIGCGYVVKRSAGQAINFCERMLKETNNFLQKLYDEEKWLNSQMSVTDNVFGEQIEIIEEYKEDEEVEWRKKHRDNIRKMKLEEKNERERLEVTDNEVFSMLDKLELMEDLDKLEDSVVKSSSDESESSSYENIEDSMKTSTDSDSFEKIEMKALDEVERIKALDELKRIKALDEIERIKALDEVEQRKIEIEKELAEQTRTVIKTEKDIIKRLDELEKEEELLEEMELLTTKEIEIELVEKLMKIRFNEQVRTNYYDSSQCVTDKPEPEEVQICDDPVTLEIRFSHSTNEPDLNEPSNDLITKPSDLYEIPYKLKSILKNKNRLFDEPQHTGDYVEEQPQHYHVRKHRHRERSWICQDSFSTKNDSDQENANVLPQAVTEVKEKVVEASGVNATSTSQPKKRQSRFSVSRALLTKK